MQRVANSLSRLPLRWSVLLLALAWPFAGCASDEGEPTPSVGDEGVEEVFFDEDYGKALLGQAPQPGKEDSINGRRGLAPSVDSGPTAVWEIRNQWADSNTTEARRAGIAWPADSGLDWDEKYALWIESMERIDGHDTYYQTFMLTTPWGKEVPAPSLECAETSIFLRIAFASWYGLPFYMEAYNARDGRVYFGHFGARVVDGKYANTPDYKNRYNDYSSMSVEDIEREGWPSDASLRGRKIYGTATDDQPFIAPDAHAGAYFDEVFLNKRVGHFLMLMLSYYGSVNLADSNNTFNLVPSEVRAGDTLLERWQRRGIGHTLVVKHVAEIPGGGLEAELVSGSMPRRQPKWEDAATSKRSFTLENTGGIGENSDGESYWKLGGGIKRWRTPVIIDGKYRLVVPTRDREFWIANWDGDRISARPDEFESLLGEVSPEQKIEVLLRTIDDKREHLRRYPASCSARNGREDAFDELYGITAGLGMSVQETDTEYRILEDYVFAQLEYEASKTCCWNSTTGAMHDIIMDLNEQIVHDTTTGTCNEPIVFMNDGGYERFREHAASLGREAEWVAWTEDEPCAQRDVPSDTQAAHRWTDFCTVAPALLGGEPNPVGCGDAYEGNSSQSTAVAIAAGQVASLAVCNGSGDWFEVGVAASQTIVARIEFQHDEGDLDFELVSAEGNTLGSSAGVSNEETVAATMPVAGNVYLHVYGYQGATNDYALTVELQ